MGDQPTKTDAGPIKPRWWVLVFGAFLAFASLAWLAVILLPALQHQPFLAWALLVLGAALFVAGLSQFLLGLRSDARRHRRLILLNGGFALAVPLSALLHNAIALISGGAIEEPVFLLAALFLPPAVIVTSVLLCRRALPHFSTSRDPMLSRAGKAEGAEKDRDGS